MRLGRTTEGYSDSDDFLGFDKTQQEVAQASL